MTTIFPQDLVSSNDSWMSDYIFISLWPMSVKTFPSVYFYETNKLFLHFCLLFILYSWFMIFTFFFFFLGCGLGSASSHCFSLTGAALPPNSRTTLALWFEKQRLKSHPQPGNRRAYYALMKHHFPVHEAAKSHKVMIRSAFTWCGHTKHLAKMENFQELIGNGKGDKKWCDSLGRKKWHWDKISNSRLLLKRATCG